MPRPYGHLISVAYEELPPPEPLPLPDVSPD
jgi:hypothetical protein